MGTAPHSIEWAHSWVHKVVELSILMAQVYGFLNLRVISGVQMNGLQYMTNYIKKEEKMNGPGLMKKSPIIQIQRLFQFQSYNKADVVCCDGNSYIFIQEKLTLASCHCNLNSSNPNSWRHAVIRRECKLTIYCYTERLLLYMNVNGEGFLLVNPSTAQLARYLK